MSNKADIHQQVLNRLMINPTLAGYVKKWYDFNRDVVLSADMPAIVCHSLGADEEYADFPKRKQDFYKLEIRGIIYIKDRIEFGKNIMFEDTTDNYVGIYKFEKDIKNALELNTSATADDLSFNLTGHFPKLRTVRYENIGQNVSAHVVIELQVDGRYFFVGHR